MNLMSSKTILQIKKHVGNSQMKTQTIGHLQICPTGNTKGRPSSKNERTLNYNLNPHGNKRGRGGHW